MTDANKDYVKKTELACLRQLEEERKRKEKSEKEYFLKITSYEKFSDDVGNVKE